MLRSNLWISEGLVNGAIGNVVGFAFDSESTAGNLITKAVLIKFDNYNGPSIGGLVPIPIITRSWSTDKTTCQRSQFPLVLAWAVTIHKRYVNY